MARDVGSGTAATPLITSVDSLAQEYWDPSTPDIGRPLGSNEVVLKLAIEIVSPIEGITEPGAVSMATRLRGPTARKKPILDSKELANVGKYVKPSGSENVPFEPPTDAEAIVIV